MVEADPVRSGNQCTRCDKQFKYPKDLRNHMLGNFQKKNKQLTLPRRSVLVYFLFYCIYLPLFLISM